MSHEGKKELSQGDHLLFQKVTRELPLLFESPAHARGDVVGKSWWGPAFLSVTLKLGQGRNHRAEWPSRDPGVGACSRLQQSPRACQIPVVCLSGPCGGHAERWEGWGLSPSWALRAETWSEGKAGQAGRACAPSATGVGAQHRCRGPGRHAGAAQNWKVRRGRSNA